VAADGQALAQVGHPSDAHRFHTHEAALRTATELNQEGRGPIDVVKID